MQFFMLITNTFLVILFDQVLMEKNAKYLGSVKIDKIAPVSENIFPFFTSLICGLTHMHWRVRNRVIYESIYKYENDL